ncbi:hypothetical protein QP162_20565 [Sphingomonas aurantiaca]|uniref:hypothetical protein n=1 Tax=Sphingomonas aurantiaca TaxID=185949 RepID=UPI002FE0AF76
MATASASSGEAAARVIAATRPGSASGRAQAATSASARSAGVDRSGWAEAGAGADRSIAASSGARPHQTPPARLRT